MTNKETKDMKKVNPLNDSDLLKKKTLLKQLKTKQKNKRVDSLVCP